MILEELLVKTDLASRGIVFKGIEDLFIVAGGSALRMRASFLVKFDAPEKTVGEDSPLGQERARGLAFFTRWGWVDGNRGDCLARYPICQLVTFPRRVAPSSSRLWPVTRAANPRSRANLFMIYLLIIPHNEQGGLLSWEAISGTPAPISSRRE